MGALRALEEHQQELDVGERMENLDNAVPKDVAGQGVKEKEKVSSVTFLELFRYADWLDIFLIVVGTTGAVANGLALPIMLIIQSRLINSFGTMQNDGPELYAETTKYALLFVYAAIASGFTAYMETTCWMCTGERQSAMIRAKCLRATLRQDVGYFDRPSSSTPDVINTVAADTSLVQEAMSEKVGILQLSGCDCRAGPFFCPGSLLVCGRGSYG